MDKTIFFRDKPVFGIDIGFNTLKLMQIDKLTGAYKVVGYGSADFDPKSIKDGVIIKPEEVAIELNKLFEEKLIGKITTRRVSFSIPASRTFTRTITLPHVAKKDIEEAIELEAEQYIPVPMSELYLDFEIVSENEKEFEVLVVAVPRNIIDSYHTLSKIVGLEAVSMEPSVAASSRLFIQAEQSDTPTVLIDFGSVSSDITIYDKGLIVTGTVSGGGDDITKLIKDKLKVTSTEANTIKAKYGISVSKKQKEIVSAVSPLLEQLLKEIRRMVRYYEERSNTKKKIGQIVTMGGGANMPGLSDYMTDDLRLPVRMCDPWQNLDFGNLKLPDSLEKSMYVTVAGLALMNPKELD